MYYAYILVLLQLNQYQVPNLFIWLLCNQARDNHISSLVNINSDQDTTGVHFQALLGIEV